MGALCSICPEGCVTIWIADAPVSPDTAITDWVRLIHLDKWELVPNRTEAPKKRTSDTGGAARKFCSDVIDWTCNVTNTLCTTDWLYCDILDNPTNPSDGKTAWFFLGWGCNYLPISSDIYGAAGDSPAVNATTDFAPYTGEEPGVYIYGTVIPPGFGLDNTTSDPATAEWTIEIAAGPYFPACGGDFNGSDGEVM